MKFNQASVRVLVRKNYKECYDFYCEKIGLTAVWGDSNGPYTSFALSADEAPCFAIFSGSNMSIFDGYKQPETDTQPDTIVVVIPSTDLQSDYKRMKAAGVEFIGAPTFVEGWGMKCVYFRDPEGNLFELNDASGI